MKFSLLRDESLWNFISALSDSELSDCEQCGVVVWEEEVAQTPTVTVEVPSDQLGLYSRLAKAVMMRNMIRYFRTRGMPVSCGFVGNLVVWVPTQDNDAEKRLYQCYSLQLRSASASGEWQLVVGQLSTATVCARPIEEYSELPYEGYRVMVGTEVIHARHLCPRHWRNQLQTPIYPVVSRSISSAVHIPLYYAYEKDKLRTKVEAVRGFVKQWIATDDFKSEVSVTFPKGAAFILVLPDDIKEVDPEAKLLVFGNDKEAFSPVSALKQHGPYLPPSKGKCTFFFITPRSGCKDECMLLFNMIQYGKRSEKIVADGAAWTSSIKYNDPFGTMMGCHIRWESGLSITYNNRKTALEEIEQKLRSSRFRVREEQYMAIVILDTNKLLAAQQNDIFYYRIKELLLRFDIASQAIYKGNVMSTSFRFFVPNLVAAMVNKLGGMAWGIKKLSQRNELVIGVGAASQCGGNGERYTYLGSAFCYDESGRFQGFKLCPAADHGALIAQLREAIIRFVMKRKMPERVVIHYYRQRINRRDAKAIQHMLETLKIACPLYVVNVAPVQGEDVLAFAPEESDYMPVSGTYVKLSCDHYLLYQNEKFDAQKKAKKVLLPVKLTLTRGGKEASKPVSSEEAHELISQTYQFCRLYGRSISAYNQPITVAYPEMVAACFVHLGTTDLPEYAENSLWFL